MWYQNIRSPSFSFVTIHSSDRRTDRRTELREQYCALHYMQLHGKNEDEIDESHKSQLQFEYYVYLLNYTIKIKKLKTKIGRLRFLGFYKTYPLKT